MEPHEQAKLLIDKFMPLVKAHSPVTIEGDRHSQSFGEIVIKENAKECAQICCETIIKQLEQLHKPEYTIFIIEGEHEQPNGYDKIEYWTETLKAIDLT